MYVTDWKSASTSIGATTNLARILSCGTADRWFVAYHGGEHHDLWPLYLRPFGCREIRCQKGAPYVDAGVTRVSKSHTLVIDSWKQAWKQCLSMRAREAYPCVSLASAAWLIEKIGR